jgi:hypothetical protein
MKDNNRHITAIQNTPVDDIPNLFASEARITDAMKKEL